MDNANDKLKNVKLTKQIGKELIKESSIELSDKFGTILKKKYKLCIDCNILIEDICSVCKIK